MDGEQPLELRDYLAEAEAVAREWYSREGIEESHEGNLRYLATLMALQLVMGEFQTFADMTQAANIYLGAAFQMGRGTGGNDA